MAADSKSSEHGAMQSGSLEVVKLKRILLVDDEPALSRVVVKVLAPDYDVVTVPSAEDALDRLKRGERFDAILADLHLPGMTGEAFLKRLEALDPDLACKVAFVTGGMDSPVDAGFLRYQETDCPRGPGLRLGSGCGLEVDRVTERLESSDETACCAGMVEVVEVSRTEVT